MASIDNPALATAFRVVKSAAAKVLGIPIGQSTAHMKFINAGTGSLGLKLSEPVSWVWETQYKA